MLEAPVDWLITHRDRLALSRAPIAASRVLLPVVRNFRGSPHLQRFELFRHCGGVVATRRPAFVVVFVVGDRSISERSGSNVTQLRRQTHGS